MIFLYKDSLKKDLIQEKTSIQSELYDYMKELSDYKIFKENMAMEYQNQLKSNEDRINSLNGIIQEKENQNQKLQETINELNGEFQSKLDREIKSELDQFKQLQEQSEEALKKSYEVQIERLKGDIESLREEIKAKEKVLESEKLAFDNMIQNLVDNKNVTIDELTEKVNEAKERLEKLEQKHAEEIARVRGEQAVALEAAEAKVTALSSELTSNKDDYEMRIGNANENFKNQLETLNDLIEKLRLEKNSFSSQVDDLVLYHCPFSIDWSNIIFHGSLNLVF